jgi:transmembrane sensor
VTLSDEQIRAAIAQQAGEWFVANQAGSRTEADNAAFLAWLKASPIHVREYLGVARVAHLLPAALGEPRVPLETFLAQALPDDDRVVSLPRTPLGPAPAADHRLLTRTWPVAASLLALAVGVLWWFHNGELFGIPKTYKTAHGEQIVERLPDGSILRLDTDSEARVHYSGGERLVEIKHGQAFFEVAHQNNRRFRVLAGDVGAIAVGTQFDVYRKAGVTEFTVVRGQIAVFSGEPSWLRNASTVSPEAQRVVAGHQVRFAAGSANAQPVAVDVDQALAWLQHKIAFEHQPLGDVAAEFNRYGNIPVVIDDEELRSLQVTGMFDAGDTESFVAFLQTLPGVRVQKAPARITVTRIITRT